MFVAFCSFASPNGRFEATTLPKPLAVHYLVRTESVNAVVVVNPPAPVA